MPNLYKLSAVCMVLTTGLARADNVILDDEIVSGSLCVGVECVDGEVFNFDTVKLKGDDPQIGFVDTSASSSFPTNDWAMGITDNALSEPAQFFIKDVSGAATVLLLEAGDAGGVAIGANAGLVDNAISFGSEGAERRVTHVAEGVDATDAVNLAQFDAFKTQSVQDNADEIDSVNTSLSQINARVDELNSRMQALIERVDAL